jgi:hypothetical protein
MGIDSDFRMAYLYYLGSEMGTATHRGTMGLLGMGVSLLSCRVISSTNDGGIMGYPLVMSDL